MKQTSAQKETRGSAPYLTALGAWALAFGSSVGWGAFVMPGTTFLPVAGPAGSALGLALGALVMLILGANYHCLMNRYPDGGGTYTFTKRCFGCDHGFLSAWFLVLTYIAIIWANATALPLIARTLLGSTFQFGFHYEIAGYDVYLGEMLLSVMALILSAGICLRRTLSQRAQIIASVCLLGGVVVCFAGAMGNHAMGTAFSGPAFARGHTKLGGVMTVFGLAPWAFVGFESISHASAEAKFPLKRAFRIMAVSLAMAAAAYILLVILASSAFPEDCADWSDYVANLSGYAGIASQPTFFAARAALGKGGSVILGIAAICAILTGIVGNYIALSRLICTLSGDGMLPGWLGQLDDHHVPKRALLAITLVSLPFPFLGRTAISWIVDVTTVGATIAYAFTSACAWKTGRQEGKWRMKLTGLLGLVISLLFGLEFLIPNIISVTTLSTESYLILASWGILGFAVFCLLMRKDTQHCLGHSIVVWLVLLGLIIFTSSVWMRQATEAAVEQSFVTVEAGEVNAAEGVGSVNRTLRAVSLVHTLYITGAILILLTIYDQMQKRERQIEVEKVRAEESSRAKSSFLSNMSHEIRTPMNAIIGLDNIALRDPDLTPRTRDHLEKIGASARHLLGLINDILDMSRIESGRMVVKSDEFSFREFIDQINIIINGQCQDKGLHYECDIVGRVSDYYIGDDMKLKQVLINILGNSVKFTPPPGEVRLTVEQIAQFEGRSTLRFTMKDTGIGMDEAFIPKIFDAFSQEDATSTTHYGGSGLGMSITKNFVEMMNGDIEVHSRKGEGTTFIVTVTLKMSSRSAREDTGLVLPENMRALVVDDDEISCEHTQIVLRSLGIEADTTTSPQAGLQVLMEKRKQGNPYTLLLTDYRMPDMSGLELTRALRSSDGGETAVIMLTGYNWGIIEEEAMKGGVDAIVAKPLFSDTLLGQIHSVIRKKMGDEPEESGISETDADEPAQANTGIAGRRVLMAEDVEQNAEILADLLDLEEVESEHACNGEIALKMFADSPVGYYDVILMDVRMPVMDGLTATRAIRALEREDAKSIPIIAMTANVFDEDVERSLQAGMNAHLSKPIEPERLYETMARLMGGA